jgi:pantoate--beta-alanine ligase
MLVFSRKIELQNHLKVLKLENKLIGFVPTMGALHDGHLSLVKKGLEHTDVVVVSVFVNPTQFGSSEDLKKYPRTLNRDVALLKTLSTNIIVYAPEPSDIYDDNVVSEHFDFDGLEHEMEGQFRSGHFDGVGTIVKRLFKVVNPDFAFFGEKDFQQLQIIKKLVEKQDLGVKVIGCEIHRETSGLAMSSRNERLSEAIKDEAAFIFKILNKAKAKFNNQSAAMVTKWVEQEFSERKDLDLEYFIIADVATLKLVKRKSKQKTYRAFIAVYAEGVRLIDNIALN